jgi:hypothetical protein
MKLPTGKYVMLTGAPGSKWSGVARSIYDSPDIDTTDHTAARGYTKPGADEDFKGHCGAYWDPGMEFGIWEWDKPFWGKGTRIIKSHTMAIYMQQIVEGLFGKWEHQIVFVIRNDYECMDPDYSYYENDAQMMLSIATQNKASTRFLWHNKDNITTALSNLHLCSILGLSTDNLTLKSFDKDMKVYVYTPKCD